MKEIVKKLYLVAGKNSGDVTKMLVYECLKGIFDSWSLGGRRQIGRASCRERV